MGAEENSIRVYHYTTSDGFEGIIGNQEIWATSIRHLKDYREFYVGRDQFIDSAQALLTSQEAEAAQEILLALDQSQPGLFVCSFTDAGDSPYHWQQYCPGGGYAIGLPIAALLNHAGALGLHIYRCEYGAVSPVTVKKFAEIIREIISMCGGLNGFRSNIPARDTFMRGLQMFVAQYKSDDFTVENETRLVYCLDHMLDLRFRMSGTNRIPYVALSLKNGELWKQAEIVVSPCLPDAAKLRREFAEAFLESKLRKHNLPTDCARSVRQSNGVGG
jgi:hypothetical protein